MERAVTLVSQIGVFRSTKFLRSPDYLISELRFSLKFQISDVLKFLNEEPPNKTI